MPGRNSYGTAFVALIVGAIASAGYTVAAYFFPIIIFGTIVPMVIACVTIIAFQSAMKGSSLFRLSVCLVTTILNVSAIWFTYFFILWGLDGALKIFSSGPIKIIEEIYLSSLESSFEFFKDFGSLATDSGITITGTFLLILWGLEALIFSTSAIVGYGIGRESQEEYSKDQLVDIADNLRSEGLPILAVLFFNFLKGLVPVAIVFGAIYVASEVFDLF
ncbi:hypothetical protein [Pararhizobium sp. IMCC21322]|uniref:hypothetical protein n=1 Tax=Pararhizobium sp. IMCC21322 TaxID=3067903 RepID=UPI0027411EEF|nr:hypothetical protein [Pararhizobium sp. IMCC21322]